MAERRESWSRKVCNWHIARSCAKALKQELQVQEDPPRFIPGLSGVVPAHPESKKTKSRIPEPYIPKAIRCYQGSGEACWPPSRPTQHPRPKKASTASLGSPSVEIQSWVSSAFNIQYIACGYIRDSRLIPLNFTPQVLPLLHVDHFILSTSLLS